MCCNLGMIHPDSASHGKLRCHPWSMVNGCRVPLIIFQNCCPMGSPQMPMVNSILSQKKRQEVSFRNWNPVKQMNESMNHLTSTTFNSHQELPTARRVTQSEIPAAMGSKVAAVALAQSYLWGLMGQKFRSEV